jgi:hypothetical protein
MAKHKTSSRNPHGGEPGNEQQPMRRNRENMGAGLGSQTHGKNQGREGGRGSGRNGRSEKGDMTRPSHK